MGRDDEFQRIIQQAKTLTDTFSPETSTQKKKTDPFWLKAFLMIVRVSFSPKQKRAMKSNMFKNFWFNSWIYENLFASGKPENSSTFRNHSLVRSERSCWYKGADLWPERIYGDCGAFQQRKTVRRFLDNTTCLCNSRERLARCDNARHGCDLRFCSCDQDNVMGDVATEFVRTNK